MQLVSFLSNLTEKSLYDSPTVLFVGSHFDVLFFSAFLQKLRNDGHSAHVIDSDSFSYDNFVSQTSISFLGQSSVFWIGDIHKLDAKNRQKCIRYIAHYTGPHVLMAFCTDEKLLSNHKTIVTMPETITFPMHVRIAQWLYPEYLYWEKGFSQKAFEKQPKMPLDSACLLMHYQRVLGSQTEPFFHEWFDIIVANESSLFALSSFFFERNAPQFFNAWAHIKDTYPLQFWLSYWSDQLFRAYAFIHYKRTKQLLKSKKMAYRLPFSFIQRDWNTVNKHALLDAHRIVYDVDYGYKNGTSDMRLDYMLSSFFSTSRSG